MSLAKNKQVKEGLNNSHRSQSREALFERDGKKAAAERIDEDICLARSLRGGFRKEKTAGSSAPSVRRLSQSRESRNCGIEKEREEDSFSS